MNHVLIAGCGYVGRRLAAAEREAGRVVRGIVRTPDSAAALQQDEITADALDFDQPVRLQTGTTRGASIYYLVAPPGQGATDPRLSHFLAALDVAGTPSRIVLLSTSGVYGDCQGGWVNEERTPRPQAERARRRLDAEQQLRAWCARHGAHGVILRVPGIYGPGRLPLERLRSGEPVLKEAEAPWSNRVHVDDLVRALQAAERRGRAGAVYNISDGHPTTMTDYFNRVADAAGLPRPPQIALADADDRLSAGMRSYLAESKRLDIRRMREELGIEPLYPDLAQGLAACLRETGSATP